MSLPELTPVEFPTPYMTLTFSNKCLFAAFEWMWRTFECEKYSITTNIVVHDMNDKYRITKTLAVQISSLEDLSLDGFKQAKDLAASSVITGLSVQCMGRIHAPTTKPTPRKNAFGVAIYDSGSLSSGHLNVEMTNGMPRHTVFPNGQAFAHGIGGCVGSTTNPLTGSALWTGSGCGESTIGFALAESAMRPDLINPAYTLMALAAQVGLAGLGPLALSTRDGVKPTRTITSETTMAHAGAVPEPANTLNF